MTTNATDATIEFMPTSDSVKDAFTGGPLVGEFVRCTKCQCCYGAESAAALKDHNHGICIGCNEPLAGIEKAEAQALAQG